MEEWQIEVVNTSLVAFKEVHYLGQGNAVFIVSSYLEKTPNGKSLCERL
jgi:hypothetical protein